MGVLGDAGDDPHVLHEDVETGLHLGGYVARVRLDHAGASVAEQERTGGAVAQALDDGGGIEAEAAARATAFAVGFVVELGDVEFEAARGPAPTRRPISPVS